MLELYIRENGIETKMRKYEKVEDNCVGNWLVNKYFHSLKNFALPSFVKTVVNQVVFRN